ncbi:MAG: hypothetical protein GY726_18080, partial [Proteobacteria bacterium]|nr:hypothetical protein [Pseudomonadota bacterium]
MNSVENLRDLTKVHLFGKPFKGLKIEGRKGKRGHTLARIYSFSYEGNYYKLPRPLVFMVEGEGSTPSSVDSDGITEFNEKETGLDSKSWRFASDIK